MSDWADFCEAFKIDPNDPDQFDRLLDQWSKDEEPVSGVRYQRVNLKAFLQSFANAECERCGGSGYIGQYKKVEQGRCFKCFPDSRWKRMVAEDTKVDMSNIYKFPMINLRQEIRDGHVSEGTRRLIKSVLVELDEFHPNSWDRTFCEDVLVSTKPLSNKQSIQLERILENILQKTEHPSFTPKLDLPGFD